MVGGKDPVLDAGEVRGGGWFGGYVDDEGEVIRGGGGERGVGGRLAAGYAGGCCGDEGEKGKEGEDH